MFIANTTTWCKELADFAAQLHFTVTLHWVPSHPNKHHQNAHEIPGNVRADKLAGDAAQEGRNTEYVHDEQGTFDMSVHDAIMHEVASLVFDVQNLFPRKNDPSALRSSAVTLPSEGAKSSDCDDSVI